MNTAGAAAELESDRDFVITRIFDASRSQVFAAWTEPRLMAQWWGPHTFTNPVCELDVRPGGAYRIVMRSTDGTDYPLSGVYREIVEPERLVMSVDCSGHGQEWHALVNANGGTGAANAAGEVQQTITFENPDGRTKLTVRMRFESKKIRDAMVGIGMNEGWSQSLERLAELLAQNS
ncbi:MAG: SRPBCC domain-containing protein [Chthoniobacterales bacterium]